MDAQKIYGKLADYGKKALIAYAVVGSLAMAGSGKTGHQSADLYLGRSQPTRLEKAIYGPLCKKLGIDTKIFVEKSR